jgi:hypothetical protein
VVDLAEENVVAPKVSEVLKHGLRALRFEEATVHDRMVEDQTPVAIEVDVEYLDAGVRPAGVELPRERAAHLSIAPLVVDRGTGPARCHDPSRATLWSGHGVASYIKVKKAALSVQAPDASVGPLAR